jgi:hypothetical protein
LLPRVERWDTLINLGKGPELAREISGILAKTRNQKLKREAAYERVRLQIINADRTEALDIRLIDEYIKLERKLKPEDPRSALVLRMASRAVHNEEAKLALENRILKEFADSSQAADLRRIRRRHAAVGKPFNLEFKDAIKGSTVSIKQLRGKVVVIDFWAS